MPINDFTLNRAVENAKKFDYKEDTATPSEMQKARADIVKLNANKRFSEDEDLPKVLELYKQIKGGKIDDGSVLSSADFLNFYHDYQREKQAREKDIPTFDSQGKKIDIKLTANNNNPANKNNLGTSIDNLVEEVSK